MASVTKCFLRPISRLSSKIKCKWSKKDNKCNGDNSFGQSFMPGHWMLIASKIGVPPLFATINRIYEHYKEESKLSQSFSKLQWTAKAVQVTIKNFLKKIAENPKCRGVCHLLTNGSSAVNGCRQNESPNSW